MNFGHYTIWYNHESHVWDIYDGRKGFRYPEYTVKELLASTLHTTR